MPHHARHLEETTKRNYKGVSEVEVLNFLKKSLGIIIKRKQLKETTRDSSSGGRWIGDYQHRNN